MARKRVSSMAELNKAINGMLVDMLNKDNLVSDSIKYTESDMVEQVVYDRYAPNSGEPWIYERRKDKGGLADVDNMYHEAAQANGKVKMKVLNLTPPNPKFNDNNLKRGEVAHLVEGGDGAHGLKYHGSGDGEYTDPRPFQEETVNQLLRDKEHVQALKTELKAMGLSVK